jgi:hypothetical protein
MNDIFFLLGVFCGMVLIVIYVVQALRVKKTPDLADGVMLLLSGATLSTGVKLCYIAFNPPTSLGDDRTYIVIGGVAVIWVSIQTIAKILAHMGKQVK